MSEKIDTADPSTVQLDEKSFADYYPSFLSQERADELLKHLLADVDWRKSQRTTPDGTVYELPRLQCWMADPEVTAQLYQKEKQMPWSPLVRALKEELEAMLGFSFDYVLLNLYRDGNDRIGAHRDDEAQKPEKSTIASISLGAPRTFFLKPYRGKKPKYDFLLSHGSLIVMRGETQLKWVHGVPPDPSVKDPRVNLTFRKS